MNTVKAGKGMWASFDEDHSRILAEILNDPPGVRCEVRTPFVTIYSASDAALERARKVMATDARLADI
jgi:hypothetical protein